MQKYNIRLPHNFTTKPFPLFLEHSL